MNPSQIGDSLNFETDICIIGGGPAGISIAVQFIDTAVKVTLITGGTWSETAFNRELNKGLATSSHEPFEENRRRQFGGGTAVWGGRCIPLDHIDFETRPWAGPYAKWPISIQDLDPYFNMHSPCAKLVLPLHLMQGRLFLVASWKSCLILIMKILFHGRWNAGVCLQGLLSNTKKHFLLQLTLTC
ncbi:hypothetical protein HH214_00190 [Mucilaginibacter robiniae]|uniref:FAD/NAD(P)-binding domain-containing protein n=1 Tax=Mucilaginibacter robiniae TaxID=2728022 RepID=A0A7L5DUL7_9SPHI|nr:hypothetical protein HH214_00190 [Mucilaginibacter robiniae]